MHSQPHPIGVRSFRIRSVLWGGILACSTLAGPVLGEPAQYPLFMGADIVAPPLTMLVMGRDHTLYYEAYNDASDLNDDGVLDVGYKPDMRDRNGHPVDYFGYFDSHLCYDYDSANGRFAPSGETADKTCGGNWSGDFLNYLTTSRIDALRKVLYGGRRIVDLADLTVLERSYIPQDAHSWGKEYRSAEHDGYDIADYAPFEQPLAGTRHLFANTTLLKTGNKEPLLRVLENSSHRIWEWVAIERPVAGDQCNDPGGTRVSCTRTAGTLRGSHPANAGAYQTLVDTWAHEVLRCGSDSVGSGWINTTGANNNPFNEPPCRSDDEYYLTIIKGQIEAPSEGWYLFATNGDDAVEVLIDGRVVTGWYAGHAARTDANLEARATGTGSVQGIALSAGWHDLEFRHEETTGSDSYQLLWKPPGGAWAIVPSGDLRLSATDPNDPPRRTIYTLERYDPGSVRTDYTVRVEVCDPSYPDAVCKAYPAGSLKPTGVLQAYGESDEMMFGLLTGSYLKNLKGGVLRKNITSFRDEINTNTGQFLDMDGIVDTIDRLRIVDFNMSENYQYQGGWRTSSSMATGGSFPDWGNPIGEMLYETLRYFSGKSTATGDFLPTLTGGKERVTLRDYVTGGDSTMDLPAPSWRDPYYLYTDEDGDGTFEKGDASPFYCSPGAQLVISDLNPSFDTDSIPGTYSGFGSFSGDIAGLNSQTEADAIWSAEHGGGSSTHFIGQSKDNYDGAPSAKAVDGLGSIRGLAPSEPTKQGGYYSAGIARYGFKNDLRADIEDIQDINTFSIALAAPLPKIEIPVGTRRINVVPFAKSVGGSGYSISAGKGSFQPTNTIVDFFVDTFANTDPAGSDRNPDVNEGRPFVRFRINFEDVEQGADHDMDAIVVYELKVNDDNSLTVDLISEYAAGSIIHHLGYVISGTTADGVYLEVRDKDTSEANDPAYFLDTPAGLAPGDCDGGSLPTACAGPLPLLASRNFEASSGGETATLLDNPLWYAAKYGSEGNEDLASGEASPNYFLVTNAGTLQKQLETAFESIILLGKASASAIAVDSVRIDAETLAFQAQFDSEDWSGTLKAAKVKDDGTLGAVIWRTDEVGMPAAEERAIFTYDPGAADRFPDGIPFDFAELTAAQKAALGADETDQRAVLDWIRGDQSLEGPLDTDFRQRELLLGDIVNSNPRYDQVTGTLYVGANDGMLHAFHADDTAGKGQELFAYVPNALFPTLANLTGKGYVHRYFVDGSPSVGRVEDQSVLIGTLGAGGRAVFALDVTDPDDFGAADVLWEISAGQADFAELGYMVGQMSPTPVIGQWNGDAVAVFGNGFDSGTGATLFVVDALTGALVDKLTVSTESDNGLAGAVLVLDDDGDIAAAYAGDLKGNLWKFDFTGADLVLAANGGPLFVARDGIDEDANRQPITAPINVTKHPLGGFILVFGTGQYMRTSDPADPSVQTAYGVRDDAVLIENDGGFAWSGGTSTGRVELLEQSFLYEDTIGDRRWRIVSNYAMDWGSKRGWFIDLVSPRDGEQGERINYQTAIIPGTGEVMFTSIVPTAADDPCRAGSAYRWIFVLDVQNGGISRWTRFDVNDDGVFDVEDVKRIIEGDDTTLIPYIGFTTDFGGSASPSGEGTNVVILDERKMPGGPPRQSWRQLR